MLATVDSIRTECVNKKEKRKLHIVSRFQNIVH